MHYKIKYHIHNNHSILPPTSCTQYKNTKTPPSAIGHKATCQQKPVYIEVGKYSIFADKTKELAFLEVTEIATWCHLCCYETLRDK